MKKFILPACTLVMLIVILLFFRQPISVTPVENVAYDNDVAVPDSVDIKPHPVEKSADTADYSADQSSFDDESIDGGDGISKQWSVRLNSLDGSESLDAPVSAYNPAYGLEFGARDYGPILDELKDAMNAGDNRAAYTIYLIKEECASIPASDDEYYEGEIKVRQELPNQLNGQELAVDS